MTEKESMEILYKPKFLVVDDEKVIRGGCHEVLTQEGYEVLLAESGEKGFDLNCICCRTCRPSCQQTKHGRSAVQSYYQCDQLHTRKGKNNRIRPPGKALPMHTCRRYRSGNC